MMVMQWTVLDTWIVTAGVLCAMSCALLGNFLVLRKMSMMGDAISHAVLPGLASVYLLTHSRDSWSMMVGAGVVGVLTAVFTQWVHRVGKVDAGASMGVVFTGLFAVGLVLIVRGADAVDLDPGCVLYGAIEMVPLDVREVFGWEVPRAVVMLGVMFMVNLLFVVVFYKELKISSFDEGLATSLGVHAGVMHYMLMVLVAATVVACFESVGSILVIAMLIVPGAAAYLLTDRLPMMIVLSLVIGAASAVLGHISAVMVPGWMGYPDTTTAGMMAVVSGVIFVGAMLCGPRHGVVSRFIHRMALRVQIVREDVLGLLYRLEELNGLVGSRMGLRTIGEAVGCGWLSARLAVGGLARSGMVQRFGVGYQLTDAGRSDARDLVRSHRLWESYLHKYLNLPGDHVHEPAMRLEHITDAQMQKQLSERTDQPVRDPQGKEIPPGVG